MKIKMPVYVYYISMVVLLGGMLLFFANFKVKEPSQWTHRRDQVIGALHVAQAYLFDSGGKRIYHIESNLLNHQVSGASFSSGNVNLHYLTEGGKLLIQADEAEMYDEGRFVKLKGAVQIEHFTKEHSLRETVITEDVLINTKTQRAVTVAPAEVTKGKQIVNGEGLEINLITGKIKLLKNVRIRHA
ncbi:MAG: LPS export ABC transporter periplasmic protein LptC [Candidatus Oxydemutatoraceae bacterium WSBS_2016_MAG_OTU14]